MALWNWQAIPTTFVKQTTCNVSQFLFHLQWPERQFVDTSSEECLREEHQAVLLVSLLSVLLVLAKEVHFNNSRIAIAGLHTRAFYDMQYHIRKLQKCVKKYACCWGDFHDNSTLTIIFWQVAAGKPAHNPSQGNLLPQRPAQQNVSGLPWPPLERWGGIFRQQEHFPQYLASCFSSLVIFLHICQSLFFPFHTWTSFSCAL